MSGWRIDKSCVTVQEAAVECPECGEKPMTHFVQLDIGSQAISLFDGCKECSEEFTNQVIDSLPEPALEES